MSGTAPDKAQFSPRGLKLVAAAALAGILLALIPVGIGLLERGIGDDRETSFAPREAILPVYCAGMLCIPLFLSLRALKRGRLPEEDSDRLLAFVQLLTILAVAITALTIIFGVLIFMMVFF